jgi:thiamine-monophosphate kinase
LRRIADAALLAGGDDYELCFTAPARARARVQAVGRRLGIPVERIGRIEAGRAGSVAVTRGGRLLAPGRRGFDHFG